jgi:putative hydrolase of HD superfamily
MVTIHDLVEVDAGDTFAYDPRALWEEFEEHQTPEARFANALDRFQALLLNFASGGGSWNTHGVRRSQVMVRMEPVRMTLPALWPYVLQVIDGSVRAGLITEG